MQSGPTFFGDIEADATGSTRNAKPLWKIDLDDPDNEREIRQWCLNEIAYLSEMNRARYLRVERNLTLFRGIQYFHSDKAGDTRRDGRETTEKRTRVVQKMVINHLYDLTMQKASRLIEYKPAVTMVPPRDDWEAKIASQMTEKFVDHIWYVNRFESEITPKMAVWSRVMGEAYTFVLWDPDKGPIHPKMKDAQAKGMDKIPLLDDNGQQQKDEKGNPLFIDRVVHIGDVSYELDDTFNVLLQRDGKTLFTDVDYLFRRKLMALEEAKLRWPDFADKIKGGEATQIWDFERMEVREIKDMVVIWYLYYRPSLGLPNGREIVLCKDTLLDNKPYTYKHGKLPCTRLVDITRPRELHGASFFDNVKGATGAYNNVTNAINRNQVMCSAPKWMMPAGVAKKESLSNDVSIVEFKGPIPPKLVQVQPTPAESFNFRKELKQDFEQVAQVYGVSRGAPPPGIDAGIALQFLEEQENKAANPDVLAMNEWIRDTVILTVGVAGQNYQDDDERTIHILGRNQQWMRKKMNVMNLQWDWDVRVNNSSALPKGRAARMQSLVYLQKNFPDLLPQEQVLEMMDLAQSQKFIDAGTVAVRAAEAENDEMLMGNQVQEPADWEDHIQHWKIHARQMQEYEFKVGLPQDIQQLILDHMMATEYKMWDRAQKDPRYLQSLEALPLYPMVFDPVSEASPMAPGGAPAAPQLPPGGAPGGAPDQTGPMDEQGEPVNPALGGEPQATTAPGGQQDMAGIPQPPAIAKP